MELLRTLASLAEPPAAESPRLWAELEIPVPPADAFTDLFVLQLPPFASIYLGTEGMLGGDVRERIADFAKALGIAPTPEPDHLTVLLGLYASLREAGPSAAHARAALLYEHVLCWVPAFLVKLDEIAVAAYRAWGGLLRQVLAEEAAELASPPRLPLHLREAPPLCDPRSERTEVFLAELLAPVRSGLVIVRSDLARGARDLGLAMRAGERRFSLGALLGQDPAATLGWLRDEARAWIERHRKNALLPLAVRNFWMDRAEVTAVLLEELRAVSTLGRL